MQIESDEIINDENSNSCENLNNCENLNISDNNSIQDKTRSHQATCILP